MGVTSGYIIKNIGEIYNRYNIMPQLGLHMLRVAAVGSMICDNWMGPEIHKDDIVAVLLIHDLGNIVKFTNLDPYWEGIRKETIDKYGSDDHEATNKIAQEIGVEGRIYRLLEMQGNLWGYRDNVLHSKDYDLKICCYGDSRVAPYGIVSAMERMDNLIERKKGLPVEKIFVALKDVISELEKQVFSHTSIKPEYITDANAESTIKSLGSEWLKGKTTEDNKAKGKSH
ncbi:MAG: hypothetical protein M1544_00135 [Candidatus Marsarchaeota archaeon]|nr:hypothetical protein [Candidatus Marsarchaeota archaeon]